MTYCAFNGPRATGLCTASLPCLGLCVTLWSFCYHEGHCFCEPGSTVKTWFWDTTNETTFLENSTFFSFFLIKARESIEWRQLEVFSASHRANPLAVWGHPCAPPLLVVPSSFTLEWIQSRFTLVWIQLRFACFISSNFS